MTPYEDGTRFEQRVRNHLIEEGYWVARTAGSKTKVDLIAMKTGELLLVQCKRSGKISPAERVELLRLASMVPGGLAILAHKDAGKSAILLDLLTGPAAKNRRPFHTDLVGHVAEDWHGE